MAEDPTVGVPTILQLRCAFAALDTGSVAGAARQLGRGSSAVSAQLTALEIALGTKLFLRRPDGLVPTPEGRRFERTARPVLREIAAALHRAAAGLPEPPLLVGVALPGAAPGSPAEEAVAQAAAELRARLPRLHLVARAAPVGAAPAQSGFTLEAARDGRRLKESWVLAGPAEDAHEVGLPELPPVFAHAALAVARTLRLEPVPLGVGPERLDEAMRPLRLPVLVPSLLLPGWLRGGRAEARLLPCAPGWRIRAAPDIPAEARRAGLGAAILRALAVRHLTGRLDPPDPETWPFPVEQAELDCLAAAWRETSLTRAARALGTTQPAATLRLQRLEAAVGRPLFDRHSHGLSPTPAGAALARSVAAPLRDLARLGSGLARRREHVRAGCVPALDEMSLLAEVVARTASDWKQRYPTGTLQLSEALSSDLRRMVLNAEIDCAFVDADAAQPGLSVRPITREPMVAVSAAGSRLLGAGPVAFAALAACRLALPSRQHGLRWIVEQAAARAGLEVAPAAEIDSLAATMRLVKSGGWVTLLPVGAVRGALAAGTVQVNAVREPTLERRICLVRRHGEPLGGEALALADLFAQHMEHQLARIAGG